jgi:hypothetical protein
MVPDMASDTPKGTVRQHPEGTFVAVRMGPSVAVGDYFVLSPDNGGYYENDPEKITEIDGWAEFTPPAAPPPAASPPREPAATSAPQS